MRTGRLNRRLGTLLAIVIASGGALVLAVRWHAHSRLERAKVAFEAELGSLEPASYAPPPVARDDNAAVWLQEGIEALELTSEQTSLVLTRMRSLGSAWDAADEAAFLVVLDDTAKARGLLERAAGLERSSFDIDYGNEPPRFDEIASAMPAFLHAGRLLTVECDFRLQRGELEAAIAALRALERMTGALRQEPLLLTVLTGHALEHMALDRLEAVLDRVDDAMALRSLARDLDRLERSAEPMARALAFEAAVSHQWRLRRPERSSSARSFSPLLVRWGEAALRRTYAALGGHALVAAIHLEKTVRIVDRLQAPTAGLDGHAFDRELLRRSWLPGTELLLWPAHHMFADRMQREQANQAARRLARTALELRRARLERGAYPLELAELPISPYTGEAATYVVGDEGGVELAFAKDERAWGALVASYPRPPRNAERPVPPPNLSWRLGRG